MHQQVLKDTPGKCPLCGMDLVPVSRKGKNHHSDHNHNHQESTSHDHHDRHHTNDFLRRFWISLIITVPILLLSKMVQQWLGFNISFKGDKYVLFALSTFIYLYGGMPFLKGIIGEIKARSIGMMTLVAIAISVAYFYSSAVVFGLEGMDFFWELATLIDIMLLGHWLEMRSQTAAYKALQSLVALLPTDVTVIRDEKQISIPLSNLKNGEIILIKPGEKIAADGLVVDGHSYVNESMLTGESLPVKKEENQKVIAGTINGDGALRVKATGIGKDSYLNKIINLVQDAQANKSKTQNLADLVAKWLTFLAIGAGIITFFYWFWYGMDIAFALERTVTVMVTACPHALGVAIPLVVAISTTQSATNGLLIRNRTAFEATRNIDMVIFDKTGTLTKGSHEVQHVVPLSELYSSNEIIQYVAALQQNSEHHIAKGVMRKLQHENLDLWKVSGFEYMQGVGVKGEVNGKNIIAAGPNYFKQNNLETPPIPDIINQDTETVNFVLIDDEPAGVISLSDSIREGSKEAIDMLKKMGIQSFLLTGDNEKIAESVAEELGMDGFMAGVLPHDKQEKVKELQESGQIVAMTGDGVNDAPALAQANVGIAVGSGTDVAADTADIVLVDSDPRDVSLLINFGRKTYRKMIQNLVWAVGYNVLAIPLAAGILYPKFLLSPALGAILMSASTIIVAFNATLLKLNK